MATVSERLAYILTFDTKSGVRSVEQFGKKAEDELGKAEQAQERLNASMKRVGAAALAFAGVAGVGLFKMAQGANNAQQNLEALEQVVGDLEARNLKEWADGGAEGVGLASQKAIEAVTSFAELGKMAGITGGDLSNFSTGLVQMAADFSAFKNVKPEQALQDIRSGFSGSVEVMRKYGIFLDDITLKAAYFRETGEKVTGVLTGQQKVIAVNSELYRQGADMLGQWGRESDQLQGRTAVFQANMQNLSDAIGRGVLPAMTGMMGGLAALAGGMSSLDESTGRFIGTAALAVVALSGVTGGLLVTRAAIQSVTKAYRTMGTASKAAFLGTIALTAVVLTGAAIYESYASKKREAKRATDDLTRAMRLEGEERDKQIARYLAEALSTDAMVETQEKLNISLADMAAFVRGESVPAITDLISTYDDLRWQGAEGQRQMNDLAETYGLNMQQIEAMIEVLQFQSEVWVNATGAARQQDRALLEVLTTTNRVADAYQYMITGALGAEEAVDGVTLSAEEQAEANKAAERSAKLWAAELDRVAQSSQDAVDAQRELLQVQLDAVRQTFDLEKATIRADIAYRDFEDQIDATNEVVEDSESTPREVAAAWDALRLSALGAADEVKALAEAHASETGASEDAQASASAQIAELLRLRDSYPGLRAEIDQYIDELNNIPGAVPTNIQLLIDSGELADLERAVQLLDLVAGQRTATVTVLQAGGPVQAGYRAGEEFDTPAPSGPTRPPAAVPSTARTALGAGALTLNVSGQFIGSPPAEFAETMSEVARQVEAGRA